jgi:hypothetical protein
MIGINFLEYDFDILSYILKENKSITNLNLKGIIIF